MTSWTKIDVLFDIDSYLQADNWDAGKVLSVDVDHSRLFDTAEYRAERDAITAVLDANKVPDKLRPLAHCMLLAKRWRVSLDVLVINIVLSFNREGYAKTAAEFRFPRQHRFSWLPKTGIKVSTGIVWNQAAGCYVHWLPAYCPENHCLHRELRDYPAKYVATPLVLRTNTRAGRNRRLLPCETLAEGLAELRTLLSSAKAAG